jgi:hypothetical protein
MTKTLQEIQEFNRRKIICSINGTEDYEEALKKEEGDSCHYLYKTNFGEREIIGDPRRCGYNREKHHPDAFLLKVIGKPLTLDRVLLALLKINITLTIRHKEESIIEVYESIWCEDYEGYECIVNFDFDLTKPTLDQQSEYTQREIYELLGGENEYR